MRNSERINGWGHMAEATGFSKSTLKSRREALLEGKYIFRYRGKGGKWYVGAFLKDLMRGVKDPTVGLVKYE